MTVFRDLKLDTRTIKEETYGKHSKLKRERNLSAKEVRELTQEVIILLL